jgi:mono/diheme cytochrome c family protein
MAVSRLAHATGALAVALGALTVWAWTERDADITSADVAADVGPTAPASAALDGSSLFRAKGCATCHDGPGVRSLVGVAPSLAAVTDWPPVRRRDLAIEDYLRQSILEPAAYVSREFSPAGPLGVMPPMPVSPAELDALVTYLLTG